MIGRQKFCNHERESVDRHRRVSQSTQCSRDSSRKSRCRRSEKSRGIRIQMTTIILRVAKNQKHQQQSIIQIQILWQIMEVKTSFRAMSKSKARLSSKRNCSSTGRSKGTLTLMAF